MALVKTLHRQPHALTECMSRSILTQTFPRMTYHYYVSAFILVVWGAIVGIWDTPSHGGHGVSRLQNEAIAPQPRHRFTVKFPWAPEVERVRSPHDPTVPSEANGTAECAAAFTPA